MIQTRPQLNQPFRPTTDRSNSPAWRQLITNTLTMDERVPLVTTILSDRDQVETVRGLSGDDAQKFIDIADKVHLRVLSPQKEGWVDSCLPFHVLSVRCWIVSRQRPARAVYVLYIGFVATRPFFHEH